MDKKIDSRKEVEIKLDFPVQLADRLLEKVVIRRPVMRDMIKHNVSDDMSLSDGVGLIADLCGMAEPELEEMDTCDFEKLQNQLLSFRGASRKEGGHAGVSPAHAPVWN